MLANLENDPTKVDDVEFFRGDPSDETDLLRAGIDRCSMAIVLADESTPAATDAERDARTLFTVLAVETVNADAYTCVEVIRSENRRHFANTHANELVISAEVTGALLAGSAANPGLSRVVTNLVTHPDDQEFYRIPVPADLVGQPGVGGARRAEASATTRCWSASCAASTTTSLNPPDRPHPRGRRAPAGHLVVRADRRRARPRLRAGTRRPGSARTARSRPGGTPRPGR